MNLERKWITREEIAEIHDSIARKVWIKEADNQIDRMQLDAKGVRHTVAAQNIRATENLYKPTGSRV